MVVSLGVVGYIIWSLVSSTTTSLGTVTVEATQVAMGVSLNDSDANLHRAEIWFKRVDETTFRRGLDMVRAPLPADPSQLDNRWVGSIFYLDQDPPGTKYNVQVRVYAGANLVSSVDATNPADGTLNIPTATEWWTKNPTCVAGTPHVITFPGSATTVKAAIQSAKPGDTVCIQPGTYSLKNSVTGAMDQIYPPGGTATSPVNIVNANPAAGPVIFDASDGVPSRTWTLEDPDRKIYSLSSFTYDPYLVIADDTRLFDHATYLNSNCNGHPFSLRDGIKWDGSANPEWQNTAFPDCFHDPNNPLSHAELPKNIDKDYWSTATVKDGYYYDKTLQKLFVRLPESWTDRDPSHHQMHVAGNYPQYYAGFYITGGYVNLSGVEIRYSYFGVWTDATAGRIANSTFRFNKNGIFSKAGSSLVIEDNQFLDSSIPGWPWYAMKNYERQNQTAPEKRSNEVSGIKIRSDSGTSTGMKLYVIRRNTFDGLADSFGIVGRNSDIYDNTSVHLADDSFELDTTSKTGYQENMRLYNNTFDDPFTGFSLAPTSGLSYLINNAVTDYMWQGIKTNSGGATYGPVMLWNNTIVSQNSRLITGTSYGFRNYSSSGSSTYANKAPRNFNIRNNITYTKDLAIYTPSNSLTGLNNGFWPDNNNQMDNNVYYTIDPLRFAYAGGEKTLGQYQTAFSPFDANSREETTDFWDSFVNASQGNVGLKTGHPAIGRGGLITGLHCPKAYSVDATQKYCLQWDGAKPNAGVLPKLNYGLKNVNGMPVMIGTSFGDITYLSKPFVVTVVKGGKPAAGHTITLDFSTAPTIKLMNTQLTGTVDCAKKTLSLVTDSNGVASFQPLFGGYSTTPLVTIKDDQGELGKVAATSTDLSGSFFTDALDLSLMISKVNSGTNPFEGDLNLDGIVNSSDLSLLISASNGTGTLAGKSDYCK